MTYLEVPRLKMNNLKKVVFSEAESPTLLPQSLHVTAGHVESQTVLGMLHGVGTLDVLAILESLRRWLDDLHLRKRQEFRNPLLLETPHR